MDLLVIVPCVLAITAAVWMVLQSSLSGEALATGAAIFLIVFSCAVIRALTRGHKPTPPPKTSTFRPFRPLDEDHVWPRTPERASIVAAILEPRGTIPIVVGSSGVGKSTLLRVMVPQELERQVPGSVYKVIADGYPTLRKKLYDALPVAGGPRTVIVLDQFESWLGHVRRQSLAERGQERSWLLAELKKAAALPNCTILLSLRREWYYDLRFLGDLVPTPSHCCDIHGPHLDDVQDEMRQGMLESLDEVLDDKDLAAQILARLGAAGRLSPVKVQIVGAVLESRQKDGDEIDLECFENTLGGMEGAIDAYFESILNGFVRPKLCLKILCSLSMRRNFREEMQTSRIMAGLFEDRKLIVPALAYLDKQRLVTSHRDGGRYELTHDFLADFFGRKSGAELNPIERDTISVCTVLGGGHNEALLLGSERDNLERRRLGRLVLVLLFAVMGLRFLYPGADPTVGQSIAQPVSGSMFDSAYILILVPYAVWVAYVATFYDRVFIYLKEESLQRAFSVFIVVNLGIAVLIGIVFPFAWLLLIGLAGVAFGLKLVSLARRPELNASARRRLIAFGRVTVFNLALVATIGAAITYYSYAHVNSNDDLHLWLLFNFVLSGILTYGCLVLMPLHVSRSGVSQLLGLIGRPVPMAVSHGQ